MADIWKLSVLLVLLAPCVANGQATSQGVHVENSESDDPTVRTTEQLLRQIESVKELYNTRLNAMDKAVQVLQAAADSKPSVDVVSAQVDALEALHDQKFITDEKKFSGIDKQFLERDVRIEQLAIANGVALQAALQAQKEAAQAQNESILSNMLRDRDGFTKQIDQIMVLLGKQDEGTSDKIDDMKSRLNLIEGRSAGMGDSWGVIVGAVGIAMAIGTFAMTVLSKIQAGHRQPFSGNGARIEN